MTKKKDSRKSFDRWTSNGLGTSIVEPMPAKNRKAVEEINKEMQKKLKSNKKG